MAETIADRLRALGIELPAPAAAAANYIPVRRSGNLLIVSGQLPMEAGTVRYKGKLGGGVSLEDGQAAARLCAINILAQVAAACGDLDRVGGLPPAWRLRRLHSGIRRPPQGDQRRLRPDGRRARRGRPPRPRRGRRAQPAVRCRGRGRGACSSFAEPMRAGGLRRRCRPAPSPASPASTPSAWDRLVPADSPFLSHAFLTAMEASRSASEKTGWQPFHLLVEEAGRLVGAAPLYVKSHSYGEYVFDHGWAEGYRRAGGRYYPKLLSAVPFTPVPGPRLLAESAEAARAILIESLEAVTRKLGLSSLHVNFCTPDEAAALGEADFLLRRGIQFHWDNLGYRHFRGLARRAQERQAQDGAQGARAGPRGRRHPRGGARRCVASRRCSTSSSRSTSPPSTSAGATPTSAATSSAALAARDLRDRIVLVVARHEGRMVGAALNVRGSDTLYGRQWGCLEEFKFLHFEACYYQAVEFAIRHGLKRVEAGAQGIHKLHRGYAPVWTHSAHLILDPAFREAVARFLAGERLSQEAEMAEMQTILPYRNAGRRSNQAAMWRTGREAGRY